MRVVSQLKQDAAGLSAARLDDFQLHGTIGASAPVRYVLASYHGKEYTIKGVAKDKLGGTGQAEAVRRELRVLTSLHPHRRVLPLALTSFEDDDYLYCVYATQAAIGLPEILSGEALADSAAVFYTVRQLWTTPTNREPPRCAVTHHRAP